MIIDSVNKELKTIENVDVNDTIVKSYYLPTHQEENVSITLENGVNYKCQLLVSFCNFFKFFILVFHRIFPLSQLYTHKLYSKVNSIIIPIKNIH